MPVKNVTRLHDKERCVKCAVAFLGQRKYYMKEGGKEHGPYCPECFAEISSLAKRPSEPQQLEFEFPEDEGDKVYLG